MILNDVDDLKRQQLMNNADEVKEDLPQVCSTFYAAKLLGLSVGTVQSLVESGDLKAWRTKGGHRRIFTESVRHYQIMQGAQTEQKNTTKAIHQKILVIDEDQEYLKTIKEALIRWGLSIECIVMRSTIEAILNIDTLHPTVILVGSQVSTPELMDLIKKVMSDANFSGVRIIAMTDDKLNQREKMDKFPKGIVLVKKPLETGWLQGYLEAICGSGVIS